MSKLNFGLTIKKLHELASVLESNLPQYDIGAFSFIETDLFPTEIVPAGTSLPLKVTDVNNPQNDDAENAISLHKTLTGMNPVHATDDRIWVYLAHGVYLDYMRKRWAPNRNPDGTLDAEDAKKKISQYWFVKTDVDRSLRRHGLARLWWAAEMTHSPWKDVYFEDMGRGGDPYEYTNILLSSQDLYQGLLERSLGRDKHILITILELCKANPDLLKRSNFREFIKKVNVECGYRLLGTMKRKELKKLIISLA